MGSFQLHSCQSYSEGCHDLVMYSIKYHVSNSSLLTSRIVENHPRVRGMRDLENESALFLHLNVSQSKLDWEIFSEWNDVKVDEGEITVIEDGCVCPIGSAGGSLHH